MLHKVPGTQQFSDRLQDRTSPSLPYWNVPAILFLFSSTCIIIIKTLMPWFFYRPGNIPFQFINSAPKSNNIQIILFCKLIQRKRFPFICIMICSSCIINLLTFRLLLLHRCNAGLEILFYYIVGKLLLIILTFSSIKGFVRSYIILFAFSIFS